MSTKSSSEKLDRKIKSLDANQKDWPNDVNDQQPKQPWRRSSWLTVEDKDVVSVMSLNKKAVRSISSFDNGKPLRNAKPGRPKDKRRRLIHGKLS